jgi:predicted nucleotidyltransferase
MIPAQPLSLCVFDNTLYIWLNMNAQQTFNAIKSTVYSFLPNSRVLLFGSRARGESDKESDYDLLIVTNETFAPRVKMDWQSKIRKALVYAFNAPFDVFVESENDIGEKMKLTGHIVNYAMKDAIEL